MKNSALFWGIFFIPMILFSQSLKIIQEPITIDANISEILDINNRLCAAVQIITDMDDLEYISDRGVVRVEVHSGMEVVYMSPGERYLKVIHPEYGELIISFADYDIILTEKKVVQTAISFFDDKLPSDFQFETASQTALLTIITLPKAVIYLDGKVQTQLKEIPIIPKTVTIRAEMPKAVPEEISILLKPNDNVEISLYPKMLTGSLEINVYPNDSNIELISIDDDYFASTGSHTFTDLPVGEYTCTIKRNGFKNLKETVIIHENDQLQRDFTLEALKGVNSKLLSFNEIDGGMDWYWVTFTSLVVCGGVAYLATDGFRLGKTDSGEGYITIEVPIEENK